MDGDSGSMSNHTSTRKKLEELNRRGIIVKKTRHRSDCDCFQTTLSSTTYNEQNGVDRYEGTTLEQCRKMNGTFIPNGINACEIPK